MHSYLRVYRVRREKISPVCPVIPRHSEKIYQGGVEGQKGRIRTMYGGI